MCKEHFERIPLARIFDSINAVNLTRANALLESG
jgi:hypothetical protein